MAKLGKKYSSEQISGQHFHRSSAKSEGMRNHFSTDVAAWCLAGIALLSVLWLHLLPALIAGLLVFELVHVIAPPFQKRLSSDRARLVAVVILSFIVVGLLTAAIIGVSLFFKSDAGSLPALVRKLADIVEGGRDILPHWIMEKFPTNPEALRDAIAEKLRQYAPELQLVGKEAGRTFAHILIGMIIGAMIALREAVSHGTKRPLAHALKQRVQTLGDSFRRVVFAQIRISFINTIFTAIYLIVVLPFFGIHLPLTKTMIIVTFVVGLLPVAGNLISNTVIVIISLSHSLHIAMASLAFLVVIHKLEYFLNARIIGTEIKSRPWELLIAMLVMEAAFGLPGVAAAPIYYAYLKQELADRRMV